MKKLIPVALLLLSISSLSAQTVIPDVNYDFSGNANPQPGYTAYPLPYYAGPHVMHPSVTIWGSTVVSCSKIGWSSGVSSLCFIKQNKITGAPLGFRFMDVNLQFGFTAGSMDADIYASTVENGILYVLGAVRPSHGICAYQPQSIYEDISDAKGFVLCFDINTLSLVSSTFAPGGIYKFAEGEVPVDIKFYGTDNFFILSDVYASTGNYAKITSFNTVSNSNSTIDIKNTPDASFSARGIKFAYMQPPASLIPGSPIPLTFFIAGSVQKATTSPYCAFRVPMVWKVNASVGLTTTTTFGSFSGTDQHCAGMNLYPVSQGFIHGEYNDIKIIREGPNSLANYRMLVIGNRFLAPQINYPINMAFNPAQFPDHSGFASIYNYSLSNMANTINIAPEDADGESVFFNEFQYSPTYGYMYIASEMNMQFGSWHNRLMGIKINNLSSATPTFAAAYNEFAHTENSNSVFHKGRGMSKIENDAFYIASCDISHGSWGTVKMNITNTPPRPGDFTPGITPPAESIANDLLLKAYPNPASDRLTLSIYGSNDPEGMIRIVDVTGKILRETKVTGRETKLDISNIAPGIYNVIYTGVDGIRGQTRISILK